MCFLQQNIDVTVTEYRKNNFPPILSKAFEHYLLRSRYVI